MYIYFDQYGGEKQFTFRLGHGSTDALLELNVMNKLGSSKTKSLVYLLYERGVDQGDINIIKKLYSEQAALISIEDKLTNQKKYETVLHHLPNIFNSYSENISKCTEKYPRGYKS